MDTYSTKWVGLNYRDLKDVPPSAWNNNPIYQERLNQTIRDADRRAVKAMKLASSALLQALEREHPKIVRNLRMRQAKKWEQGYGGR